VSRTPFPGPVYGLSYAREHDINEDRDDDHGRRDDDIPAVVITGPGGAAWSPNEGDTWYSLLDVANYWAVAFANEKTGWLVGTGGRILKISF
jgi:hypothetical protein